VDMLFVNFMHHTCMILTEFIDEYPIHEYMKGIHDSFKNYLICYGMMSNSNNNHILLTWLCVVPDFYLQCLCCCTTI